MTISNAYEDARMAGAYSLLEFAGTYHLAYRDLPAVCRDHVVGTRAIDFGCGSGRSTRFLTRLGFRATGVDISGEMIKLAREKDPGGDYRLIDDDGLGLFEKGAYDLIQSLFTFDNVPTRERKVALFAAMARLLAPAGRVISLVSSPELYVHEWTSFSTRPFPENRSAKPGDTVRTIIIDIEDRTPIDDVFWPDENYREVYREAGLEVERTYKPLANGDEPFVWVNETRIAPWVIYVLRKADGRTA